MAKVIQMPLDDQYAEKLEAAAKSHERVARREAAWIVRNYLDGRLVLDGRLLPALQLTPESE